MARRKGKKNAKKASSSPGQNVKVEEANETKIEEQAPVLTDKDVERHSAAIRAIRDVEIERLVTELRLLRSYFNQEQLQTPLLQFFEENLPNLSISGSGEGGEMEVEWKDRDGTLHTEPADGLDLHTSLLRRLSLAYPNCSAGMASLNGFELSSKSVKTSIFDVENLKIPDFVLEEPSDTMMLGMPDVLQTPGVNSQRLSIGMTPKTRRLPKHGEMLVSVHGSPLGIYKEDNMEAIHGHIYGGDKYARNCYYAPTCAESEEG